MRQRDVYLRVIGLRDPAAGAAVCPATPEERLALLDALSVEAWTLTGKPMPAHERSETPVSVRRLRAAFRRR